MSCPTLQDCQNAQALADAAYLIWQDALLEAADAESVYWLAIMTAEQMWWDYINCENQNLASTDRVHAQDQWRKLHEKTSGMSKAAPTFHAALTALHEQRKAAK